MIYLITRIQMHGDYEIFVDLLRLAKTLLTISDTTWIQMTVTAIFFGNNQNGL